MNRVLSSILVAGLIIGASFAVKYLGSKGLIAGDAQELSQRSFNIIMGLIVVWFANLVPKRMKPLAETNCDPAHEQSLRRFAAQATVIGGLLYALAWLAAPYGLALPLSILALGGALPLVLARCLVQRVRG